MLHTSECGKTDERRACRRARSFGPLAVASMVALLLQLAGCDLLFSPAPVATTTTTSTTIPVSLLFPMVNVPGGSFEMGSPEGSGYSSERPVRRVTLTEFWMSQHEVTQGQYQAVMGRNPSVFNDADFPVEYVRWIDAVEFCNRASEREGMQKVYTITGSVVTADLSRNGYRLPTEAEWEYAARGGNGSPGDYIYSGSNALDSVAWYEDNSGRTTHRVGSKAANGLGIYDMSGNVWEWCHDLYGAYRPGEQSDPVGVAVGSHHVVRGGSWGYSADHCRSTGRHILIAVDHYDSIGIRIVRRL